MILIKKIGGLNMDALAYAMNIEEYVIEIQRNLHMHPEISMQEERTMEVVMTNLKKMNIKYEQVINGGIIGIIDGNRMGKTIVLRADLDALPMKEASKNLTQEKKVVSLNDQAAHTCGHDGHTAMLLGAAKILSNHKDMINGRVILAFEQGEENGKGIYRMLQRLVEIGADGVWGIHLKSDVPSGKICVDEGPRMAAIFPFNVLIKGKSGHGSRPDLAKSPIDCFTTFYNQLRTLKFNQLDPFKPITYSIGHISAGSSKNIIPETLEFGGTARFLHREQGLKIQQEFNRLLAKVCDLYECTFEYIEKPKFIDLIVYNNKDCATIAQHAVSKALGDHAIFNHPAWMASETFSLYQKYFPGVFAFLGIENKEKGTGAEHHNAHFELDEDVLKLGVAATVQFTIDFLNYNNTISYYKEQKSVEDLFMEIGLPTNN